MPAPAPATADSSGLEDAFAKINPGTRKESGLAFTSNGNALRNNDSNSSIWRESSYDFSQDSGTKAPPPNNDNNTDFGFVAESPLSQNPGLSRINESPNDNYNREVRVSFHESVSGSIRRRSNASGSLGRHGSPNASSKRKSSLLPTKSKSRLLDPPLHDQIPTPKTPGISGMLGKANEIEEDDDPFWGEDLPEEYKKMKLNALTLIEIVSLLLLISALICSLTIKGLKKIQLWRWLLMVLVLICGRLVSGWSIRLVVLIMECNFLLRKRVLYFVYGLRKAVQNCIWLTLVLIAWQCIFDKKFEKVINWNGMPYITNIWVCLLVGTFIWLLKTLLVKVLASSFHVSTFFDRIQESLFNQYVIQTLSGPPLIEIQQKQEDEESVIIEVQGLQNAGAKMPPGLMESMFKGGKKIGKSATFNSRATPRSSTFRSSTFSGKKEEEKGITIDHLHLLNQKNISAWNMKRMMNIIRKGVLSTLDENLRDSAKEEADSSVDITSEKHAKTAAKKIFYNVAQPGSKFIYLEDMMRFMRHDEASKTFRLFEGASEGKGISKSALKNWLVNAFRERRALALSLNDTKTAVNKLHQMLNVVVAILMIVISLLILKVTTVNFFIFFSSQILLVVFIFGDTCKTTFEAIIFLFVMHPFDVGDRVEVDGVQMVVEEMNILTTVFLRYDKQKIIYPNSVLSKKPISNYYRSPDMGDAIEFCTHVSTPMEKIGLMKERITRYIEDKREHWQPSPSIVMRDVVDMNRLKWSLWITHTMNYQDMGERWARRALLVEEMVKIFKDLDIEYRMLPVDVNVRNVMSLGSTRPPSNWTVCSS